MSDAPNLSRTILSPKDLLQGHTYVMTYSDQPGQEGSGFYEILEPVTDKQFLDIHNAFKRMGIEAYHVECIFRADTTFILSNRFASAEQRTLTFEIGPNGAAQSIPKRSYQ